MSEKKTKEYRKTLKERSWEFVSNIDSIAVAYGCSVEEAVEKTINLLQKVKYVRYYAGIVHDKDKKEDGSLKAAHVHIVLVLKSPVTPKTMAGALGMPEQTINKIVQTKLNAAGKRITDIGGALSYLTHRNAKDKYQYDDSAVFATPGWDWRKLRAKSEAARDKGDLDRIVEGIISGEIRRNNFTDCVDPYTYIQPSNKRKIDNAFAYRENMLLKEHSRSITCMYFYGKKGTGKTSLAKKLAEDRGLSYFISGGANDPFDSYGGEDVVIIDDARPDMFQPEEWLKLLDNNTSSLVHSRYHNRIIEAKYIILTSTIPLFQFFSQYVSEDELQLYRRIKVWAYITNDYVELYEWKSKTESYELFDSGENPIKSKFRNINSSLSDSEKENISESLLVKDVEKKESDK